MAAAADLAVAEEVDEVDQELTAHGAHEAGGVPTHARPRPRCKHRHLPPMDRLTALKHGIEQCTDDSLKAGGRVGLCEMLWRLFDCDAFLLDRVELYKNIL